MDRRTTLAFEIGTEELPAFDLAAATKQLPTIVQAQLSESNISFGTIETYSTPRRLIIIVEDISLETDHIHEEHRGPSASIAFDESGAPTKAAIGFAKGKGIDVKHLERREVEGAEYVFATVDISPRPTKELLPELLLKVIHSISWPKSCKWSTQTEWFARPVRWLLALLGEEIIPFEYASLTAGNTTRGHRFLSPGEHRVESAQKLIDTISDLHIVPSEELRKELILQEVADVEQKLGLTCKIPEKTLTEVINLTEFPTVLCGSFDKEFLAVPEEIIVDAMLMHQRYFPLYDASGVLSNSFIVVSNGDPRFKENIIIGNERVVRARLYDAKFFFEEDLKTPLADYVERLDELIFQESLGTMKDKTDRLVLLAEFLAAEAGLDQSERTDTVRSAYLSKADLVSNAVVEFTSVQGVMGAYYARASQESERVAQAIREQYLPRYSGDDLPSSKMGQIISFADKLDTICSLFSVDQAPTGSSDPFALRRGAIGIINMLLDGLNVRLEEAIHFSLGTYDQHEFNKEEVAENVRRFFSVRIRGIMVDRNHNTDVVDAVLAVGIIEPYEVALRVQALEDARTSRHEIMEDLATAYTRAHNLSEVSLGEDIDESLMGEAELALKDAIVVVEQNIKQYLTEDNYEAALGELAALRAPIDRFFEDVLIMDKDEKIRTNRLRLLNKFVSVFSDIADFKQLS